MCNKILQILKIYQEYSKFPISITQTIKLVDKTHSSTQEMENLSKSQTHFSRTSQKMAKI